MDPIVQASGTRRASGKDRRSSKVRSSENVLGAVGGGGGASSAAYWPVGEGGLADIASAPSDVRGV